MIGAVSSRAQGVPTRFVQAVRTTMRWRSLARALEIARMGASAVLIWIVALSMCPAQAAAFQLLGQVTNESFSPIENVDVVAKNPVNDLPVASGATDAAGNFTLSVPAGTYKIVLTPPMGSGFGSATVPGIVVTADRDLGTLTLISIVPAVSFSGVLRDAGGTPVAAQTVSLCYYFYNCPYSTTSGADGSFSIGGISAGTYHIYIVGGGGTLPQEFHVDGPAIDLSTDTVRNLSLPATAELSITVKDPTSQLVSGAGVTACPGGVSVELYSGGNATAYSTATYYPCASDTTDGSGTVSFLFFDQSAVTASANAGGFNPGSGSTTMSGNTALEIDLAEIPPTPTPVNFSGVLRDADGMPLADQSVRLCTYFYNCPYGTNTTADGFFSISGVPPGAYAIYVAGGGGTLPQAFHVDGPAIDLATDTVQDLTLPQTATLTVTVKDPTSQAVSGASVLICPGAVNLDLYPGGVATAYSTALYSCASDTTDGNGSVPFVFFDQSSVNASATANGFAPASNSTTLSGDTPLEIGLGALVSFSGVLRDADGMPAGGQGVALCSYFYSCPYATTADSDGAFSITGVLPGMYYIYVAGGGGIFPQAFHVDGPAIILATDTVQDLTLPPTAVLTVTVKDPTSDPVDGASVTTYPSGVSAELYPGGGATAYSTATFTSSASGTSDASGSVPFVLFDESAVTAYASASGFNQGSNSTTMAGDTPLEVDLGAIPPPVAFSGVLRDGGGAPLANQRICLNGCGPSTMTDGAGSFSIGGIAPGSYYIYLDGGGGATLPDSFYLSGPYVSFSTDVMQDLTVPTITLTVTVIGPQGAISGVQVSAPGSVTADLFSGGTFSGGLNAARTTDANGVAVLPLIASASVALTATPPMGSVYLPNTLGARTFSTDKSVTIILQSTCGDGIIQAGEACDDHDLISGDGCSSACQVESCFTCTGLPSACMPQPAGTGCPDDGNACTTDTCDAAGLCTHPAGNAGAVCRAAASECDVVDLCSGSSPSCGDVTKPDGTVCGQCAGDQCVGGLCSLHGDADADGACDESDDCPATANPDQRDGDGDGIGDVCDNCPDDFNAAQSDGDQNGAGDLCEAAPPSAFAIDKVRFRTSRHPHDGTIFVRGTLDPSGWGNLQDALAQGLVVGVSGGVLSGPQRLEFKASACTKFGHGTRCKNEAGLKALFRPLHKGNGVSVRIRARDRDFVPAPDGTDVQVVLSFPHPDGCPLFAACGGLDRRDEMASCRKTGPFISCRR